MKRLLSLLFTCALCFNHYFSNAQCSVDLGPDYTVCAGDTVALTAGPSLYAYIWSNGTTGNVSWFGDAGIHWVECTDTSGCVARDTILIHHTGVMVDLGPDTTVCGSYTITPNITLQLVKDSIKITYDATLGVSGLSAASKVYVHAGAELVPFGGWQYVTGNWGQDDSIGIMKNAGVNLWEITIHPQTYFGYSQGTQLNGIFMVFRNADGSATGKDDLDQDIFLYTAVGSPSSQFGGVSGSWIQDSSLVYLWSDGSTAPTLTVNSSGTYWLMTLMHNNCEAQDFIQITISPNVVLSAITTNPTSIGGHDGSIDLTVSGGTSPFSYVWDNVFTGEDPLNLQSGQYCVTVTDSVGCMADTCFTLIVNPCAGISSHWASPITPNSARLNWSPAPTAHHYNIRGRRVGSTNWVNLVVPPNPTFKNVFGLSYGFSYEWQIRSACDAAETSVSAWTVLDTFTADCYPTDSIWTTPVTQ